MKQVILKSSMVSLLLLGTANAQSVPKELWATCRDNRLQVRFSAGYHQDGMTYLKELTFKYVGRELTVETQSGFDRCHVLGMCPSFVTLPYQEGKWGVVVDGKHLGTVRFAVRFDGNTRSDVESCTFGPENTY